jgi:hypothetical protein
LIAEGLDYGLTIAERVSQYEINLIRVVKLTAKTVVWVLSSKTMDLLLESHLENCEQSTDPDEGLTGIVGQE